MRRRKQRGGDNTNNENNGNNGNNTSNENEGPDTFYVGISIYSMLNVKDLIEGLPIPEGYVTPPIWVSPSERIKHQPIGAKKEVLRYFIQGFKTAKEMEIIPANSDIHNFTFELYGNKHNPKILLAYKPSMRLPVKIINNETGHGSFLHNTSYMVRGLDEEQAKQHYLTSNTALLYQLGYNAGDEVTFTDKGNHYELAFTASGEQPQSEEAAFEEALQAGFHWQVPQHTGPVINYNNPHHNVPSGIVNSNNNSVNNPFRNPNTNYNYNNSMNPSGGRRRHKSKGTKRRYNKKCKRISKKCKTTRPH